MVHVMQQRQIQPQYQFEAFFAMSSMKKDYDQALATLHEFTKQVIRWSHLLFLIRILWNMIKSVQQVREGKARGFWEWNFDWNSWRIHCCLFLWHNEEHKRKIVQSGFWNSWRILGLDGCDKNSDQIIRWFCLSEKNVLKWLKLILQYRLKKILLQHLKVRFFKMDSLEFLEYTRKKIWLLAFIYSP